MYGYVHVHLKCNKMETMFKWLLAFSQFTGLLCDGSDICVV